MIFDAAIIGSGPAGSAAAITLSRAGVSVVLIESRAFPRAKVCGEYISPAATGDLLDLLSTERLAGAGAKTVNTVTIASGTASWTWKMPRSAWVLSRASLDTLLAEQAQASGAVLLAQRSVRSVEYTDRRVELLLSDQQSISARIVIHADGSGRLDPLGATPIDTRVIGLKCYLRPDPAIDGLVMRPARGAYIGLVGIEQGLTTCALVARADLLRAQGGDRDALLATLWPGYRPAWRSGDWLACPVPRSRYRGTGHPRSFRMGNAGAAIDPVGGEGIGNALWSGRLLGKVLADPLSSRDGPDSLAPIHAHIRRAYAQRLRTRLPACRMAALTLMRPGLANTVARIGSLPLLKNATVLPWMALTGKPMRA